MTEGQPPEIAPTEDYWQALLEQGEIATVVPDVDGMGLGVRYEGPETGCSEDVTQPNGYSRTSVGRRADLWEELETWHAEGRTFTAPVIGCNKGGLLVRVREGIGFLPASQLVDLPCSLGTDQLRGDLEHMVGREFTLRVIELDRSRNRVICSERAAQWDDGDIEGQLVALDARIGGEIDGVIRSLCDFGAFVDLGHIDGLIHISEISWQRVAHPSEVLDVGERLRVKILNVDHDARRVGLSLKRLQPNPWPLVRERYSVGSVIDAIVTNVVDFGAFASVEEGVEGLIHISELADDAFVHPLDVVSEGQRVRVRVLHIDPESRRLGLSMRQA